MSRIKTANDYAIEYKELLNQLLCVQNKIEFRLYELCERNPDIKLRDILLVDVTTGFLFRHKESYPRLATTTQLEAIHQIEEQLANRKPCKQTKLEI